MALNEIRTSGVLIVRDNKVLLVNHGKGASHMTGSYGLPAGRVRDGETEIDCAIRELEEETGLITSPEYLEALPKKYHATIQRKEGIKNFNLSVFLCKNYSGELKSSDEANPEWIETDKLPEYNLLPNVAEIISDGIKDN